MLNLAAPNADWFNPNRAPDSLQVSSLAPSSGRTVVREDWALVGLVGGAGWGGDWSGSSW